MQIRHHEFLDGVRDVGNDLDRGAEIFAAPLLGDDLGIDLAGGDVVRPARIDAREPLVMTQIEVGFGAVLGDEDFAVLIGAHGARIDIDIGIQLAQPDLETARLQAGLPSSRRGEPLTEGGDHAAGNEDVPRHGPRPYTETRLSLVPNARLSPRKDA